LVGSVEGSEVSVGIEDWGRASVVEGKGGREGVSGDGEVVKC